MRVAITGGVCDGKTTVLNALGEKGFSTISADGIVRELYSDPNFLEGLGRQLGEGVIEGGRFNRDWVRERLIRDPGFRRELNRAVHPAVAARLRAQLGALGTKLVFVEVPLLIEAAMQGHFYRVWVVDAGPAERRRRLLERLNGDEEAVAAQLKTQLPTEAKSAFADRILRTDCPMASVKILAAELAAELA